MKKIFNTFNIIYLLLIITTLIGDIFYILDTQLWVKALASASFVGIGVVSLVYTKIHKLPNLSFAITMVIGLTFAMLGDIVLNLEFMIGAILFAVGHIIYFIAYCILCRFKWTDLIAGGIISLASVLVILFIPVFTFSASMKILILIYAIVISFMLGKSLSNLIRERNLINLIIFIGSLLFFFSDLMLLFDNFSNLNLHNVFGLLCLASYYPAEILLALSPSLQKKAE
ncbi:MAG: lysoplasmalogenase [Clostridiales bacterium]|nr:lysoplasmalogenase [Clostridiales bacterium]